ncbi:hypothetical protein RDWZM_002636 [Blomia tropicalis]|uniref:Replication protein A C-terminal domain-containing protein n=1 Tax=Blomia tropicalis TaxID=40697 RepID=A0A9Q0RRT4_BLOTA|nr:DNA-directed RNA polymerase I subunit rpa2 [Blomia tropicalis]KAJ6224091.1 hypothetical protein RDWZM_002636 [Blomia tropicalis]
MGDFFKSSQFDDNLDKSKTSGQTEHILPHVHVTLSHVSKLTRQEEGLVMYRQKIGTITVIGVVKNVQELATKNIYLIDDHTCDSPVEVNLWKNGGEDDQAEAQTMQPPTIMEKTYIRVIGQARYHELKPFVVAFSIETITDPNEIYTHSLEVIHDGLLLERRMKVSLKRADTSIAMDTTIQFGNGNMNDGFNEVQRKILNVLKKYGAESVYGLKRNDIKNYLPGVSASVIESGISYLVNEGHIFNTSDDDTFKSTDF